MKKYLDISHHETVKDWDKVKEICPFLISKATEGTSFVDPTLGSFIQNCEKQKIPYWLYTYLRKGNELAQAKFMVKTCKNKVGKYFVGYILDVEADNVAADVKEALNYITGLGGKSMLYTMYAQYDKYKEVITRRPDSCAWWEARYGKNETTYNLNYPCHLGVDFHQFTDEGTCAGISGEVDLNRLTGTKPESWFMNFSDDEKEEQNESKNKSKVPTYKVGTAYKLQVELKVRTGPGTNYEAKKYSQLTTDGKKHDKDGDGALDKGTIVTCKKVKKRGSDIWIKSPSGWLAAYYKGKIYIK